MTLDQPSLPRARSARFATRIGEVWHQSGILIVALVALSALRLMTLPKTPWELDEILFMEGVRAFNPVREQPHPPGYPLLIGLGKVFAPLAGGAFGGLVALAFASGVVGFLAFAAFVRRVALRAGLATQVASGAGSAAALLYWGSPGLLVHGSLALSDASSLAFVALSLWSGARILDTAGAETAASAGDERRLWAIATGAFTAAAIGCRPQLVIALVPFLLVTALLAKSWRTLLLGLSGFTVVCLAWFVPLVAEYPSPGAFLKHQKKQASFVAAQDAEAARAKVDTETLFERFYVNAWGRRRYALPVFALAGVGAAVLLRRRVRLAVPLAVLAVSHGAFCWWAMDPADGPRYGLPVGFLVAGAAGCGLAALVGELRRRSSPGVATPGRAVEAAVTAIAALYLVLWLTYVGPFLRDRATIDSPPLQAADALRERLQRGAIVLVEPRLAPQSREFLPRANRRNADSGFDSYADRPETPLWVYADGPSGWPGGLTFEWPETHAFQELTRNFYRQVSVSPIPPQRRYEAGRGVYAFEPTLGRATWRWLGRSAAVRLHPGDRYDRVRLGLALGPEAPANQTRIAVDGAAAGLVALDTGAFTTLDVALPHAPTVEITFESDTAFRSPEGRDLAVQLTSLEMLAPGSR
jgi:4-amino-4-deoxy-L-arabinose transferase-like glycosyltransferase